MKAASVPLVLTTSVVFTDAERSHDRWADGFPVSGDIKRQCCGDAEAHLLLPGSIHALPDGWHIDGYSRPVPYGKERPSPDGNDWGFWKDDRYGRKFVLLCRRLDLFGGELLAVDGTRIKAVNNKDRNFTQASLTKVIQEADEKLAAYMKRLDEGDADEARMSGDDGPGRGDSKLAEKIAAIRGKRDRHKAMLADLDRTGEDQISLTDPDARAMAPMTKVGVGYNVQLAVDVKHKLIAEQAVTNQVLDMGLLAPTAAAAMDALGVGTIGVVADKGYFKIEDIEACEKAGVIAYVPKPIRGPAVREGLFSKEEFRYEAERDVFICPGRAVLSPLYESRSRDNVKMDDVNRGACKVCALRPRCTKSFRRVSRLENEAVLDRVAARLAARPDILDRRRETIEHPFGAIKQWMGQGAFLMRRLENVRAEFSLTALAYNIRRAITLVRVPGLIAAATV